MPSGDKEKPSRKERIDVLLVERGLAKSRERAKSLILAGSVLIDEVKIDKVGTKVASTSSIRLLAKDHPYVSRGALKLVVALDHFRVIVEGGVALDAGASTGGFTQVLLERGVRKVYAVDVGYGILDLKLRNDERVVTLEKINVRNLTAKEIPESMDIVTADLSFISLKKVLPVLARFLRPEGTIVALIKPQFEVGRKEVEKGGLVKDPAKHSRVVDEIRRFCADELSLEVLGVVDSPILGTDGNKEFFICCKKSYGL